MRSCLLSNTAPHKVGFECTRGVRKKEEEEKKERGGEKGGAQTKTHRLETSLFGAVTRTDWAAAVWVKENIFVVVVLVCVLKSEDYTCLHPLFCTKISFLFWGG